MWGFFSLSFLGIISDQNSLALARNLLGQGVTDNQQHLWELDELEFLQGSDPEKMYTHIIKNVVCTICTYYVQLFKSGLEIENIFDKIVI